MDELERLLELTLFAAGKAVQRIARSNYLSGPRPSKLDRVTGNLAKSIVVTPLEKVGYERIVKVGTHLGYGLLHEFGLGRFPPRPFLRPALLDAKVDIIKNLVAILRQSLKR